jgi:hypothetical protein
MICTARSTLSLKKYVGKTFFEEDTWEHSPKRIENLFGCEFEYREGGTPWLVPVTADPVEFSQILERAARTDMKNLGFPRRFPGRMGSAPVCRKADAFVGNRLARPGYHHDLRAEC